MPHLTLKEFADLVKRNISSLSKPAREIELKLQSDEKLASILAGIRNKLKEIPKSQSDPNYLPTFIFNFLARLGMFQKNSVERSGDGSAKIGRL